MRSEAQSPEEYIKEMPEERQKAFSTLRKEIKKNLPKGFKEIMNYGMMGWVVPHSLYPDGYHCKPSDPLPFMGIASQKNFIAVYHMGIYADPFLMKWFTDEFKKRSTAKLDMGKSCIRFKKPGQIPLKLLGELVTKQSADEWIEVYEEIIKK